MRRPSRTGLLWMFAFCVNIPLAAQNLESIGREKPLAVRGGISFNQIFYATNASTLRRAPFTYFASGNVNLLLYGWSIPLSLSLSNHRASFSQPFNRYSVHPSWRSVTVHAGYTSMSFSPYTVNGHVFRGAGIDFSPEGRWKLSAFHGRLLKAVHPGGAGAQPSYQRTGYGFKSTYGMAAHSIDLVIFSARDETSSIQNMPDSISLKPQENLVVSLGGSSTIVTNLIFKMELAASAVTRDTRSQEASNRHPLAQTPFLFTPRISSSYYQAFKTSVDYRHNRWVMGAGYERIDPGYRTFGAYYFNNDLENVTLNASGTWLEDRLSFAISTGLQQDNIDKARTSTMRRMVSSLNINYLPSQRLNMSASWSSFQTHTNIRSKFESLHQLTRYENLDTLNFTQISRTASFSGTYSMGGGEQRKENLHINVSWQQATDTQGDAGQHSGARFYNLNSGYAMSLPQSNTGVAVSFNVNISQGPFMSTRMTGPNASITRTFSGRKIRATMSSSWNKAYTNGINTTSVFNVRMNGTLSVRNQHNVNVGLVFLTRTAQEASVPSVRELTATAGYQYSFGSIRKGQQ